MLAPISGSVNGAEIGLGGARQRAVLALLLLQRNRRVPADRIVDALWDEPPKSARNSVQRFIADLRASHADLADRLDSDRAGYLLSIETDELDLARFEAAIAAGDDRAALDEWQGSPLEGIGDPPFALLERTRLTETRLAVFERWVDAELGLGHHHELVATLEAEAAANPFRERIWAQLMSALYGSHRQADALAAFGTLRDTLLEELGVDPAPELRELEMQILNQELVSATSPIELPSRESGVESRGYELGAVIGENGEARVHQARQVSTGRDVAVKVIEAARADDPPFIRAFDEANKGIAGLEHPHIVPMYDWWREPAAAYVVMRLLRGGTLHGDIALDGDARRAALAQVADALRVAHDRGIHHGAVSAGNVLLDHEGNAYLTDFGIARQGTAEEDIEALSALVEQQLPGQLSGSSYDSVDDLLRALHGPVVGLSDTSTPYKGLRAFQEADAADFFGRDGLVENMVDGLRDGRFLALVGASGSGKSSAVRAGLVPRLRRGAIEGSEDWFIVDMIPGAAPLDELVRAVRRVAVDAPNDLRSLLSSGPDGLNRVIDLVLPEPGAEMLLIIDQFEELFTLVSSARARQRFVESLVAAVSDPRSRLRVVVTMRADFYDRPLATAGLGQLFQSATESVVPLTAEELERAIVGPADRAGVTFDRGVVAEMVSEVVDQPATLPLLQYALTELFEVRSSDQIGIDDYREVGGVLGALARRADWLYDRLPGEQQLVLRQLLLRLVTVGDDSRSDTRRRVTRAELESLGDPKLVEQVLSEFGRHRLLTFDRDPRTGSPVVEVAHEALLREWAQLRDWIEQSRDDLRQHRRVSSGVADWIQADRDPSFLLRGARLDRIAAWRETADLTLIEAENDFIRSSLDARRQEEAIELKRLTREAELEQQANRRLRLLVGVLAVAVVVAAGLSVFALRQSKSARDERAEAETQALRATAQGLASAALVDLDIDPEKALLLALEAVDLSEAGDLAPPEDALFALHEGLDRHRLVRRLGTATAAVYSPDGLLIATVDDQGNISLLEASDGSLVRTIEGAHEGGGMVVFDRVGDRLASVGDGLEGDGHARIWDVETGVLLTTLAGPAIQGDLEFSPDGERIATSSEDGAVQIWDPSTGEVLVRRVLSQGPTAARWLPDGRLVVLSSSGPGRVVVVDPETLEPIEEVKSGLSNGPCNIGVSPTDGLLVVGGSSGKPALITLDSDAALIELVGHGAQVCGVVFSPDGLRVATGGADGTVRVWSAEDGVVDFVLAGHGSTIEHISFDPTGTRLLSTSSANEVFEWDVSPAATTEIASFQLDDRGVVDMTAAGDRIVSIGIDGLETIDLASGDRLIEPISAPALGPLEAADISSDDRLMAIPVQGRRVEIRSLDSLATVMTLSGPDVDIFITRFDPAVEHVVAIDFDHALHRWSLDNGELLWSTPASEESSEQFEFNPAGTLIALIRSGRIELYEAETGELNSAVDIESQLSVAWLDDERFVSAGLTGDISIWQVGEPTAVRVLEVSGGSELLRFDPIARRLFVGRLDGTVSVLSLDEGREILTLPAHPNTIIGLALDASGTTVLSADFSGLVHVRTLDTAALEGIARARVTRSLTADECAGYGDGGACS